MLNLAEELATLAPWFQALRLGSVDVIQASHRRLELLSDAQKESSQAIAEMQEALNGVETLRPVLVPEGKIGGEARVLYGTASRVHLATSDLD